MNLGLLTAIWGRPRLTDLVLRYYDKMDLRSIAISSEDDPSIVHDDHFEFTDFETFAYPNDPLSDKWGFGISKFRDLGTVDAVMIVGSDDLVTPKYIESVKYLLERGADYIFLPALYFYDLQSGRMHYCLAERLGLGRVLSRRLLDMLEWKPWPDGLNRGLDGAMWEKIQQLKDVKIVKLDMKACSKLGIAAMDIKGAGNNLWDYEEATSSLFGQQVKEPEKVLRKHFPSVADELLNWNAVCK